MLNEIEVQTTTFYTPEVDQLRNALSPGQERSLGIKYLTGSVGWKSNEELDWLTELLLSEQRYILIDNLTESVIIAPERKQTGGDGNEPKTMNLELIIGVPDFFFLTRV